MSEEEVNKIIEVYDSVIADLKQENQQLKDKMNFSYHIRNDTTSIPAVVRKANDVELIKKLQQENTQLKSVLKEIRECIMSFFLTEEYIKVDGIAIANNYHELLEKIDKGIGEDK